MDAGREARARRTTNTSLWGCVEETIADAAQYVDWDFTVVGAAVTLGNRGRGPHVVLRVCTACGVHFEVGLEPEDDITEFIAGSVH